MAKIYSNDKNFLVIEMTKQEAKTLNFGVTFEDNTHAVICGSCNKMIENNKIYYVAGINEVLCEDCIDDFIKNMNHYIDDDSLRYEINHFNYVAQKLSMSEKAVRTPDSKIIISSI